MKSNNPRFVDPAAPKHQQHWDWRAAANFIAGGSGGGLLVCAAAASFAAQDVRSMILAGMALIAAGLTCVWFEIGRPWRAINVLRHLSNSWMSREAALAPFVFACGALAVLTGQGLFIVLAGVLGAAFLYCQVRMLNANKGIPAWRDPRCVPLLLATGLTEGAGLLAGVCPLLPRLIFAGVAVALIALLLVRAILWKRYLVGLKAPAVPEQSLLALAAIDRPFVIVGHVLPAVLVAAAAFGAPSAASLMIAAGLLSAGAGWMLKFTLVPRDALTQSFALKHLPVRGGGAGTAAVKPAWGAEGDGGKHWREVASV